MLTYPDLDPIAIAIGPLKIHWYGLTYIIGFLGFWWLGRWRAMRPDSGWKASEVEDVLFYGALGVVLGGRIGYTLFYKFPDFLADPMMIIRLWEGGMSFHGGLLGVLIAMAWYGRKTGRTFFQVTDFIAPMVPLGLAAGRIGNFINGELWGAPSDVPWAMQLPCERFAGMCEGLPLDAPYSVPFHPSQLYEFGLEGVALFLILWTFSARPRPRMAVSGLFLLFYGIFRFVVEFVRMPDAHLGYLAFDWVTMGQALSMPMILIGIGFLAWAYRRPAS